MNLNTSLAPTLLIIGQRDRTALVNTKTPEEVKSN